MEPFNDRSWFLQLQEPQALVDRADRIVQILGSERFFNQPGLSWLREAWNIGRLALALDAQRAGLSAQEPPDGYIELPHGLVPVEVTEALEPGRRRGHDYRNPPIGILSIEHERLCFFERSFVEWVVTAAHRKLAMEHRFPQSTLVLIHLSAWLMFLDKIEIWERLFDRLPSPVGNVAAFAVFHSRELYLPPTLSKSRVISLPQADEQG